MMTGCESGWDHSGLSGHPREHWPQGVPSHRKHVGTSWDNPLGFFKPWVQPNLVRLGLDCSAEREPPMSRAEAAE
jgi:hypothetical protein